MNKLVLLAAVFAVAATGANAFPETMLSQLFRRGFKRDMPVCSGDPSSNLMACVESLSALEHPSAGLKLDSIDKAEALDFVCNEFQEAASCVGRVHSKCGQGDMMSELMIRTVMNIGNYLCDPANRQVILDEADCWENKELERDIERCGNNIDSNPYADPCSALDGVRSCITRKVASVCSAQAANFIDGLIYHALEPITNDLLHCQLSLRVSRSIWKMLPRSRK